MQRAQTSAMQMLGGAPSFDTEPAAGRTRTATPATTAQSAEHTGNAMLLAGLLVMGVIIKRRSGTRD
jgi:hypothetical protein